MGIKADHRPCKTLKKQGIKQLKDNIGDDQELHLSGSDVFIFFKVELQKRFVTGGEYGCTTQSTESGSGK